MKKIIVRGGKKINGEITVHSAKNSILPILAAVILCSGEVVLLECPPLSDVKIMLDLLSSLGCKCEHIDGKIKIDASCLDAYKVDSNLMHKLRSSIFVLGPLLARFGRAELGYPGGCDIGLRPIDLHLKVLKDLGTQVKEEDGNIICIAQKLTAGEVYLDYPSVGATENAMMAASLISGSTIIVNAAKEPEIVDLQNFINLMGGRISGAGTGRIVVHGVKKLGGCVYTPMPDRIVTGTFMMLCAACGGELKIKNAIPEHNTALIGKLKDSCVDVLKLEDGIHIIAKQRPNSAHFVETMPYPGFPTDLQSPMMSLQAVSQGTSVIIENVFENRMRLAGELKKMGADITVKDRMAFIRGVENLHGATVFSHDLRSGAALLIAAAAAEGKTEIFDEGFIDRGYYKFEDDIKAIGGDILVFKE